MTVAPLALPRVQLFDANGDPLAFGFLDTFAGGTLTPLGSFADAAGAVTNTNPVVTDAGGYADVFLTTGVAYKVRVRDAAGAILYTIDNIVVSPQSPPSAIPGLSGTVAASNFGLNPGTDGAEVLATNLAEELYQVRYVLRDIKGTLNWRTAMPGGIRPLVLDDFARTTTEGNSVQDPGELGTEVLATSLAQELQQLRFVIAEMKGAATWRTSEVIRYGDIGIGTYSFVAGWPPDPDTSYFWYWHVPPWFDTGFPLNTRMYLSCNAANGRVKLAYQYRVVRDGQAVLGSGYNLVDWDPLAFADASLLTFTLGPGVYLPDDAVIFELMRQGTNGADTNTGTASFLGGWWQYMGTASR